MSARQSIVLFTPLFRPLGQNVVHHQLRISNLGNSLSPQCLFGDSFADLRPPVSGRSQLQKRLQNHFAGQYAQHPDPKQDPPRRPLPRRILRFLLKYTLLGTSFIFVGATISLNFLPNRDALIAFFTSKLPSDAETLSLFKPVDTDTSNINDTLINCALAQSLRSQHLPNSKSTWIESRPHMKIPEAVRPTNLTGGTLAGPGRIAVPPLVFITRKPQPSAPGAASKNKQAEADFHPELVALIHLGEQVCGHPGIVHGGMLATLLDETLARCCFPALPSKIGVTANLQVDYRRPARAPGYFVIRAKTTKVDGRKAWVKGWIEELGTDGWDETSKVLRGEVNEAEGERRKRNIVEAEGLFVEPKNVKMLKRIYAPDED